MSIPAVARIRTPLAQRDRVSVFPQTNWWPLAVLPVLLVLLVLLARLVLLVPLVLLALLVPAALRRVLLVLVVLRREG